MLKIISPTGCVHAVNKQYSSKTRGYATMCNHNNFMSQYLHKWEKSIKDVTCKRCLAVITKKIRHKETGWTRAKHGCKHRYPHLKHGVLCSESTKFPAEVAMRKCESYLCPIPSTPISPQLDGMVKDHVLKTLEQISAELKQSEREFNLRFSMIAVHCPRRKPAIQDNGYPHMCSDPGLKRDGSGMDPKFGWACRMGICPHMFKALLWRANTHR